MCSKHDKIECDQKWEHILQYNCVGIYRMLDGRTVAEFLEQLIGASLSEPHIDELAVNFLYFYIYFRGATALLVAAGKR